MGAGHRAGRSCRGHDALPQGTALLRSLADQGRPLPARAQFFDLAMQLLPRSEEHTSELQSLMRISYAVFCLTTKKKYVHYTSLHSLVESLANVHIYTNP